MTDDLRIDPNRDDVPETGIFVRARDPSAEARWMSADIGRLDRASFLAWLRSRDTAPPDAGHAWRESVLLIVFGHGSEP